MLTSKNAGLELYENALTFSEAAQLMKTQIPHKCDPSYKHRSHSVIVHEALAIEHYLKALYYIQYSQEYDERGRKRHDIYTLYTELLCKTQKSIEDQFSVLLTKHNMKDIITLEEMGTTHIPRDLRGTLKLWAYTFMHLRLCPTVPISINLFFYFELENILKEQILTRKPEWQIYQAKNRRIS